MAHQYGEPEDAGMMLLPQLFCLPIWSILIFNLSSGAKVDWLSAVNVLLPFAIGMILGNLDPDFINFIRPAQVICLPLMGFAFGSAINLKTAAKASLQGIVLSIFVLVLNFVVMYLFANRTIVKKSKWMGASLMATTGVAAMDPALMAAGNEAYGKLVGEAIPLIAMVFLLSTFGSVYVAAIVSKKEKRVQVSRKGRGGSSNHSK